MDPFTDTPCMNGQAKDLPWARLGQLTHQTITFCIDQSNIGERSHQVSFMREIYKSAEQVLVCLSTEKNNGSGMHWLLRLHDNVMSKSDDVDQQFNGGVAGRQRVHRIRLRNYAWRNVMDEQFMKEWLAFYDLVECPWWNRACASVCRIEKPLIFHSSEKGKFKVRSHSHILLVWWGRGTTRRTFTPPRAHIKSRPSNLYPSDRAASQRLYGRQRRLTSTTSRWCEPCSLAFTLAHARYGQTSADG
jgi:hypothetical protein